jgi:polar amino acid transport system permease protein
MNFSFELIVEFLPQLLAGTWVTIQATVAGFVLALVSGAIFLTLSRVPFAPLRYTARFLVEFLRSTPLLVQAYFLFFVLPDWGLRLPALITGMLALGLHHGAYVAETYRAGLEAVPRGQWDAATSLNYSGVAAYRHIVLPQAIPLIIPALGNTLITMIKDTPILSAITVAELMFVANEIGSNRFQYTEPITAAAVVYLLLSLVAAVGVSWLDRTIRTRRS